MGLLYPEKLKRAFQFCIAYHHEFMISRLNVKNKSVKLLICCFSNANFSSKACYMITFHQLVLLNIVARLPHFCISVKSSSKYKLN